MTRVESVLEDDIAEIHRILGEAYEHYFAHSDGHCKSAEGRVSISYPPYAWDLADNERRPTIEIYSYVFCPTGRSQVFDNTADALKAVTQWRDDELATRYCSQCLSVMDDDEVCWCTLAS